MTLPTDNIDYGKIPPQSIELEEVVLGAILLEKEAITKVVDIIQPESFYKDVHSKIYSACLSLFHENKPTDMMMVIDKLKQLNKLEEIGGPFFISKLVKNVGSSANIEHHSRIVKQKHIARELIRIGSEMQTKAYDDSIDVDNIIDYAQIQMFDILKANGKRSRHISEIGKQRIKEIQKHAEENLEFTGVPTGFNRVNNVTAGWQKSDLIIIAARPSMGKTSVAFEFVIRTAKSGVPVDVYSLEMKDTQLYDKAISSETKIENTILRTGKLKDHEWEHLMNKLPNVDKLPIWIDDTPSLNITDFIAKTRRNHIENKTGLIVIDYLQLMKSPEAFKKGGRLAEVTDISGRLKAVAKELDVPVIALSQLSRDTEKRGGEKRPLLADLRESGAIEQDADIVMFIHRPEYYNIMETSEGGTTTNLIELIFAKNRNGHVGTVNIWKDNTWTDFNDGEKTVPGDETKIQTSIENKDGLPF